MGMPLRFQSYDHGKLALYETPHPAFANFLFILPFFLFELIAFSYSITQKGGSALLKSGNGGRSLTIPIGEYNSSALIPK